MSLRAKTKVLVSEFIGILFIILISLCLHYIYDLSNQNLIIGLFSPINETIWENLKLGFFPVVFYSIIENLTIKSHVKNFFTAKAISSISLSLFTIVIILTFKNILGKNISVIGIGIFITGCILTQLVSIKILTLDNHYAVINLLSFLFLFIITLMFFVYTVNPVDY